MKYHILSKEIYEEKLADLLQRREGSSHAIYKEIDDANTNEDDYGM